MCVRRAGAGETGGVVPRRRDVWGGIKSSRHTNRIVMHVKECLPGGGLGVETQKKRVQGEGGGGASPSLTHSASSALQPSTGWLWGSRGHWGNGKHPGVKQIKEAYQMVSLDLEEERKQLLQRQQRTRK